MHDVFGVDAIENPSTVEAEVHNCQAVIDSLAMDVLSTSLSHITGQDIVAGDQTAIGDLLEVFSGLMEFMLEEISSTTGANSVFLSTGNAFVIFDAFYLPTAVFWYTFFLSFVSSCQYQCT